MGREVIGVDIGGTNVRVARINEKLEIENRENAATSDFHSQEELIGWIAAAVRRLDAGREITDMGIVFPAPWSERKKMISDVTNIPWMNGLYTEQIQKELHEYQISFENDVNVIALLESEYGAAKGSGFSIYITVSTGIGSGVIINKQIYHGANGYAGEIGSIILSDEHQETLEELCSGKALENESVRLYGKNASARQLFISYEEGDEKARKAFLSWLEALSRGVAAVIQLLDPEVIVFGGPVILNHSWVIEEIRRAVESKVLGHLAGKTRIEAAKFGLDAGIIGAGYYSFIQKYKKEGIGWVGIAETYVDRMEKAPKGGSGMGLEQVKPGKENEMHVGCGKGEEMKELKVALVGAGSVSFALGALHDLVLSERLQREVKLEVALMDILPDNLERTFQYAMKMKEAFANSMHIWSTTSLEQAVCHADFVITAIEVDRYHYWSQDFHIPRLYGSKQIYGENGGPGSMFHTLRNMGPMLEIANAMERGCPDAWLLNYTNPEAKLVEAISKLTKIKVIGLCHGLDIGIGQLSEFLEMDKEHIGVEGGGLNHFGFFTKIWDKRSGEDLYPLFREKEAKANRLAKFEHVGLARTMLHIYGYYPYPGTNHCGEYVTYGEDFYAGLSLQYRYEPVKEKLWEKDSREPDFIYCASGSQLDRDMFDQEMNQEKWVEEAYTFSKDKVKTSHEYAIPIIEAIFFNRETCLNAGNLPNQGAIWGLPSDMVVETQIIADGSGIRLKPMEINLPTAVLGTIQIQGMIHQLLIEAYTERSRKKLLQAILLDPQAPTYYQACAMIDHMFQLQEEILPPLKW